MNPTSDQLKAAEEAIRKGRAECTCASTPMSHREECHSLISAVAQLLADREAKARREGAEKVAKAVGKACAISTLDGANVAWVPTVRILTSADQALKDL